MVLNRVIKQYPLLNKIQSTCFKWLFPYQTENRMKPNHEKRNDKLPRVSYGDLASVQFDALTMVLLWFTLEVQGTWVGNSEESKKEDMRGLVLGYKIETLTVVVERNRERAPSLQQHHAIDENTVCGLQIVLRLLIFCWHSESKSDGIENGDLNWGIVGLFMWWIWRREGSEHE